MATVVNLPAHRGGKGVGQALGESLSKMFKGLEERRRQSNLASAFSQYESGVRQAPNREAAAAMDFTIPAGSLKSPADIYNIGKAKQEILERYHPTKGELFFDITSGPLSTSKPVGTYPTASAAREKSGATKVASASDIAKLRRSRSRGFRPMTDAQQRVSDTVTEYRLPNTGQGRNIARRVNRESMTASIQKSFWRIVRKPDAFIWSEEAKKFSNITGLIIPLLIKGKGTIEIKRILLKKFNEATAGDGKTSTIPTAATGIAFGKVNGKTIYLPKELSQDKTFEYLTTTYKLTRDQAIKVIQNRLATGE